VLFDVRGNLEMCDAYPPDAARVGALAPLVSQLIDTEKYDFLLQRYAIAPETLSPRNQARRRRSVASVVSMSVRLTSRWVTARMRCWP
jgi:hypothetical protein